MPTPPLPPKPPSAPSITHNRTLAAIVFTDTVGFSARMSVEEEATLKLVDMDLSLMAVLCEQHGGRVIKSTGDGLLMLFRSALQAVQFAITLQHHMADYAKGQLPTSTLTHRVGIHLGEVFLVADDVMGHAVNIASRLESLAQPGGICISQAVYDTVAPKLTFNVKCLGLQQLKNIREPIRVYYILNAEPTELKTSTPLSSNDQPQTVSPQVGVPPFTPPKPLTPNDYRERQALLSKVRNFWVRGMLENSLHNRVALTLGLEERPDRVEQPWRLRWQPADRSGYSIRAGVPALSLFDDLGVGATLLILGAPGSGKTTTLLQMTRDLIERAIQDHTYSVPVFFNLSSWNGEPLIDWLNQELNHQYQIPPHLSTPWLTHQELILMLDGLDEVVEHRRCDCVEAINDFSQQYRYTEIVVCSRMRDYDVLATRLNFQGALFIQPLTLHQIDDYLAQMGAGLAGVREVLAHNPSLQELAQSPLMLSMMTLAYQGLTVADIQPFMQTENPAQPLLQTYIERMLTLPTGHQTYTTRQTQQWLRWLALKMLLSSQSVFSLENLQPSLLTQRWQQLAYRLGTGLVVGMSYGLVFGFIYRSVISAPLMLATTTPFLFNLGFPGALGWRYLYVDNLLRHFQAWQIAPVVGLIVGVMGVLPPALIGRLDEINPVENLRWSWRRATFISSGSALVGAGVLGIGLGGLGLGIVVSLVIALLFSVGWQQSTAQGKTLANEGIWRSVAIATSLIWLVDLSIGLEGLLFMNPTLFPGFMQGLGLGFSVGLLAILRSKPVAAGVAVLQHSLLRTILWLSGYTPRNYAQFLNYATRRILLQQVGSGYVFLHRLLLEHFALSD